MFLKKSFNLEYNLHNREGKLVIIQHEITGEILCKRWMTTEPTAPDYEEIEHTFNESNLPIIVKSLNGWECERPIYTWITPIITHVVFICHTNMYGRPVIGIDINTVVRNIYEPPWDQITIKQSLREMIKNREFGVYNPNLEYISYRWTMFEIKNNGPIVYMRGSQLPLPCMLDFTSIQSIKLAIQECYPTAISHYTQLGGMKLLDQLIGEIHEKIRLRTFIGTGRYVFRFSSLDNYKYRFSGGNTCFSSLIIVDVWTLRPM